MKLLHMIVIILLSTYTIILSICNRSERINCTKLKQDFHTYNDILLTTFKYENKEIGNISLIDVSGKKHTLHQLIKRYNQPLLVVYFPKCICNVEQNIFLNEIEKLGIIKYFIIVFEEINYHKALILNRLERFSCDLYCDSFSQLNLRENNLNEIFTFYLDNELKYKNLIFLRMIDFNKLSTLYNN